MNSSVLRIMTMICALALASLVAAGCESGEEDAPASQASAGKTQDMDHSGMGGDDMATPVGETVNVVLDEFTVEPETTVLVAGATTFSVVNQGNVEHELQIIRKSDLPDGFDIGEADHDTVHSYALASVHGIEGSGGTATMTADDLTPGTYILFCDLPGHYMAGQHIEVTVA